MSFILKQAIQIVAGIILGSELAGILRVSVGDRVEPGTPLLVLEAMKMEHQVVAPTAGTVTALLASPGDQVVTGQALLVVEEQT